MTGIMGGKSVHEMMILNSPTLGLIAARRRVASFHLLIWNEMRLSKLDSIREPCVRGSDYWWFGHDAVLVCGAVALDNRGVPA